MFKQIINDANKKNDEKNEKNDNEMKSINDEVKIHRF